MHALSPSKYPATTPSLPASRGCCAGVKPTLRLLLGTVFHPNFVQDLGVINLKCVLAEVLELGLLLWLVGRLENLLQVLRHSLRE